MIINKKVVEYEESPGKLDISKALSSKISENLQLLNERFMNCVKDVDTSEVEEVNFTNNLIKQFNGLVESISKNQKNQNTKIKRLEFVNLTDETGQVIKDYKFWVVGECYIENGKRTFYKRRIVRARTPKEAVFKYKQIDPSVDISLSCLGEKDTSSDYSLNIENEEIID